MTAADGLQHGLFHGLGIDADAGDAVFRQHGQLFRRHGVGAACFYRVFTQAGQVEVLRQSAQQGLQLCGGQRGGRAAADVEGFDLQPQLRRCAAHQGDFAAQSVEIRPDHGKRFFHRCADKGAVGAAGGTKWDAHVQGKFILPQRRLGFAAGPGGGQAQFCPIGGDKVFRAQGRQSLFFAHALIHHAGEHAGRANPRQRAPGGDFPGEGDSGFKEAQLQDTLTYPVPGQFIGFQGRAQGAADAYGARSVPVEPGGGCDPYQTFRQLHRGAVFLSAVPLAVVWFFAGEQHGHDLFHGVFVAVAGQS